MKKINNTFILLLLVNMLNAQNPLVKQWDKRLGGTLNDFLSSIQQTSDGGYILGGWSFSGIGGDKTQPNWDTANYLMDYWIVKIDLFGNKQWDKRFGGISSDWLSTLQQTADGGFVLGGSSASQISGDKTEPVQGNGNYDDYWIVKIDSAGYKQWDKRFGGYRNDEITSLQQTKDNGYILGGSSLSGANGDKTQPNWSANIGDYWIVKTDSLGIKQWDKRYGGTSWDALNSIKQTMDGGYILAGWSSSDSSGDKTQDNWGGYSDYWIVKIDSMGAKQWDKRFGGTLTDHCYSVLQTNDGGYILGGYSYSDSSGDKSQNNWDTSATITAYRGDYWIVKTDSLGNKLWDKHYGGVLAEMDAGNLSITSDGGYLIAGTSTSDSSGDKTENNLGTRQTWVIKTDSIGNKIWDKTLFTLNIHGDPIGYAIETTQGCYVMANYTEAGIGGYKTEPNWDSTNATYDYWIIKFCDSTLTTSPTTPQPPEGEMAIAPNPFSDEITITFQKQNIKQATFTIKNILGQPVVRHERKAPHSFEEGSGMRWDLNFLSKGIYLLEVIIDGERTVKKIVKE